MLCRIPEATSYATESGTSWSGCAQAAHTIKTLQVTSMNVAVVIRRPQLLVQPNESDKMQNSRVVVRRLGHLPSKYSAVCTMWWNVVITKSLGWTPANHSPREWIILILLRGLQFP